MAKSCVIGVGRVAATPATSGGFETEGFFPMKSYRIVVHDRREREPIELAAELGRDERAHEVARERLASSPYFAAVELWRGPVKLCHLQRVDRKAA